ncbi:hypothetical protein TNCV_417001 [Trichonephila clavipes]|nr:hypothetical protein TNCV_417001 [Trichonephila clavipes]
MHDCAIKLAVETHLRSYNTIGRTRPHKSVEFRTKRVRVFREDWIVAYFPLPRVRILLGGTSPAQPPGIGGTFQKLFCWPLRPAELDEGLN